MSADTPQAPFGEGELQSLVILKDQSIALLFCNYLNTKTIRARTEQQGEDYIIFCDKEKVDIARLEFESFIANPRDKKYQQAAWDNGEIVVLSENNFNQFQSLKNDFLKQAGMVTLAVFAVCWVVFIGSELGWKHTFYNALRFYPQLSLTAFLADPIHLIGPAFFHFSWLHIVFNTMWWWQLGGSIELKLSKGTLLGLLLISATISNIGQYLVSGANFGGLSGVVYALVGFVWWLGYLAPERGLSLSKPVVGFLLFWLVLGFVDLLPVNVANTAHLLGLLSGCFFAVFTARRLAK